MDQLLVLQLAGSGRADSPHVGLLNASLRAYALDEVVAAAVVLVRETEVRHLFHDGRQVPPEVTDAARRDGDRVIYDAGAPRLL